MQIALSAAEAERIQRAEAQGQSEHLKTESERRARVFNNAVKVLEGTIKPLPLPFCRDSPIPPVDPSSPPQSHPITFVPAPAPCREPFHLRGAHEVFFNRRP